MMTSTVKVAFRQAKDLKCVEHEVQLVEDVADQVLVSIFRVKEVVAGWVLDLEVVEPNVKELLTGLLDSQLFVDLLVVHDIVDLLEDLLSVLEEMLLQGHTLGYKLAFLGLLTPLDLFLDQNIVLLAFLLGFDKVPPIANSIHVVSFEQVVKWIEIEAFVEELEVDLFGQAHQAHGFVLDLGYQRLVVVVLGCDQLSDEVLTICFCNSLRLRIENIGQVVMIFLLGASDFDKWQHIQTW